jgi:ligand-binding sensor domain-containing protein
MIRFQTLLRLQHPAFGTLLTGIHFMMLVLFFQSQLLRAQDNFYINTHTTENGLPQNSVLSLAEDKTGFLWIGTWDGLSRFDGYEFRNYFHDPEDSTTIPYFIVGDIQVDRHNEVWIYSRSNSLARYVRESDNFITYSKEIDTALSKTGVNTIETDARGNLWVAGSGGIATYDDSAKRFICVQIRDIHGEIMDHLSVNDLSFDNTGGLWIYSDTGFINGQIHGNGLLRYIQIKEHFKSHIFNRPYYPNGLYFRMKFRIDPDSVPWLLSNIGYFKGDKTSREFLEYKGPLPEYLGEGDTLPYWLADGNTFRIYKGVGGYTDIPLLPGEIPQDLYLDKNGSVWYGTITSTGFGTGLHNYIETPDCFKHYRIGEDGKTPAVVYSVYRDRQGNLWIGSQDHPYIDCIRPDGTTVEINRLNLNNALASRHPRAILPDSLGVWIGYMQQRLDYYDNQSGKVINKFLNKALAPDNTRPWGFRSLGMDSKGNLLIGATGVYLYAPQEKEKFRRMWQAADNLVVFCIKTDPGGSIWVGASLSHLLKFSKNYTLDTTFILSDNHYNPEDICFGENGEVWIGLLGGGLCRLDPVTGRKEFFTTEDGLSNNAVYSILKDRRGNLWLSTNNGITKFNPLTGQFRIFGPTDGLQIHEFNADAAYQTPEGEMLFGGMGGVVAFYPDSIEEIKQASGNFPLVITEFMISGYSRYFSKAIYDMETISLDKGDDNFGITFACLNFKDANKIKYRYRLTGFSPYWKETDHIHRHVNFAGLSPGTYRLDIEATDNEGIWAIKRSLEIHIPPYYYQTLWFRWLLVLITAIISVFLVVLYNRQIRLKEKQKQDHLRLESLRAQMNPHFVFNSLNSINYFISKSDRLSANRYIASFSKLIRSILNHMSHEYINLTEELASLEDYLHLEFLRFGDKFDYALETDAIENKESWEVFPGMLQPFIENAIWHGVRGLEGRKGFISITFQFPERDRLRCLITDDGIGRALSYKNNHVFPEKKSRGIDMVLERLRIVNSLKNSNYKVVIEDLYPGRKECGTRVLIDLPVRLRHSSL